MRQFNVECCRINWQPSSVKLGRLMPFWLTRRQWRPLQRRSTLGLRMLAPSTRSSRSVSADNGSTERSSSGCERSVNRPLSERSSCNLHPFVVNLRRVPLNKPCLDCCVRVLSLGSKCMPLHVRECVSSPSGVCEHVSLGHDTSATCPQDRNQPMQRCLRIAKDETSIVFLDPEGDYDE